MNDKVPNGTFKILIPFDGVVNWDGVLKSSDGTLGAHNSRLRPLIEMRSKANL